MSKQFMRSPSTTSTIRRVCPLLKLRVRGRQPAATPVTESGSQSSTQALTICTRTSVDQAPPQLTQRTTEPSSNQEHSQRRKLSAVWTLPETHTPAPTHQCRIRTRSTATDTARTSPALPRVWVSTLTALLMLVHTTAPRLFLRSSLDQASRREPNCTR